MSVRRIFCAVQAAIFISTVGLGTGSIFAAETAIKSVPSGTPPLKETAPQKITINADSYGYSGNSLKAEGGVSIIDGDMSLKADIVTVKTRRIDGVLTYEQVVATGKDAPVTLTSAEGAATGYTIAYNVVTGLAELSGKAEITFSNGGHLSGADTLVMDRTKQIIRTVGGHPRALIPHNRNVADTPTTDPSKSVEKEKSKAPTEITSNNILYDMSTGTIEFTGNVHVIDDEMDLKGASLTVFRNKDGKPARITVLGGTGRVHITNSQGAADGPSADYDLVKGVLVLQGKANLRTTNGMLFKDADSVVYYRDKKEFSAKGGSIDISTTNGGSLKDLLKPPVKETSSEPQKLTTDGGTLPPPGRQESD